MTLTTNDPAQPTARLTLKANVVGSVIVKPANRLYLGTVRGRKKEGSLLLRKDPTESGELTVADVRSSKPWLEVHSRRVESPEPAREGLPPALPGDWILDVRVTGDPPRGQSRENLQFATGLAREPQLTVPVTVMIARVLNVRPARLFLREVEPGGRSEGTILASVEPDRASTELEVAATPEAFHVEMDRTGERHYRARVSWNNAGPDTPRAGNVVFRSGDEKVIVPVSVGAPGMSRSAADSKSAPTR